MFITIEGIEDIDGLMAVGANDLRTHFLPMIGIKADKVVINHIKDEEKAKRLTGEEYKYFQEISE